MNNVPSIVHNSMFVNTFPEASRLDTDVAVDMAVAQDDDHSVSVVNHFNAATTQEQQQQHLVEHTYILQLEQQLEQMRAQLQQAFNHIAILEQELAQRSQ